MFKTITRSPIFIGASWYFFEKFLRLIGAFLIGAWLARYLGPAAYGELAYSLALVATLGFLGSLGVESLVVRDLIEGKRDRKSILSTYFYIRLVGGCTVPFLAAAYLLLTQADQPLILLTILCSGSLLFGSFDAADCWLQSENKAKSTSVIRIVGFLFGATSRILLILCHASIEWFAIAVVIESALIAALYFCLLSRHGLTPRLSQVNFEEFKHLIVGGKMMIISGLTVAAYSKIDVLAVGTLLSKEAVGSYAMAASMCAAWNMVGMSIVQAWAPRISGARTISHQEYIRSMRQLLIVVLAISIGGASILSISSEMIFLILLGEQFLNSAMIFSILVWSSVFVFLGVATSQIIVNERIYWVSLVRTALGLVFSLAVIYFVSATWSTTEFAFLVVFTSALATTAITFSKKARQTIGQILKVSLK